MTPIIRQATAADIRYVRHSWSKDSHAKLKASYHWSRQGFAPLFTLYDQLFRQAQDRIAAIAECLVAVNPDDADQLLGYLIHRSGPMPIVFYVQVKSPFWRNGIAKALLDHAGISVDKPAVYAFGTTLTLIPKEWTHVPWYLMPEIYKAAA